MYSSVFRQFENVIMKDTDVKSSKRRFKKIHRIFASVNNYFYHKFSLKKNGLKRIQC